MKPLKCFISYSRKDACFVEKTLHPFLEKKDIPIVKSIQEATFIICFYNRCQSAYLTLGVANSFIKPVINIIKNKDIARMPEIKNPTVIFDRKNSEHFLSELDEEITAATTQIFTAYPENEIIGFSVGYELDDYEREIQFTSEFIQFLKEARCSDIKLVQASKGCWEVILELELEKVIVPIVPLIISWIDRKRKTSYVKTLENISETQKNISETQKILAKNLENLLGKHQDLGIKMQVDDQLLLTQDANGKITVDVPKKRRNNPNK
jgi:hypothetical protein